MLIHFATLENWKTRRQDKKTEGYWDRKAAEGPLSCNQEYQREWNFIEKDYGEAPSNNGLDLGNPGFAFDTKLAKYLVNKVWDTETSVITKV